MCILVLVHFQGEKKSHECPHALKPASFCIIRVTRPNDTNYFNNKTNCSIRQLIKRIYICDLSFIRPYPFQSVTGT